MRRQRPAALPTGQRCSPRRQGRRPPRAAHRRSRRPARRPPPRGHHRGEDDAEQTEPSREDIAIERAACNEAIVKIRLDGVSIPKIAKEFGLSTTRVSKLLKAKGISGPARPKATKGKARGRVKK